MSADITDEDREALAIALCEASEEHQGWDYADEREREAWRTIARGAEVCWVPARLLTEARTEAAAAEAVIEQARSEAEALASDLGAGTDFASGQQNVASHFLTEFAAAPRAALEALLSAEYDRGVEDAGADYHDWIKQHGKLTARIAGLTALVKKAPHANDCETHWAVGGSDPDCTCWKSRAGDVSAVLADVRRKAHADGLEEALGLGVVETRDRIVALRAGEVTP